MIVNVGGEIRHLVGTISVDELRRNRIFRAKLGRLLRILYGPFVDEWMLLGQPIRGKQ